jgi:hypothetical protein
MTTQTQNQNQHNKSTYEGKYASPRSSTARTSYGITSAATSKSYSTTTPIASNRRHTKKKKRCQKILEGVKKLYNKISKKDVKWYWDLKKWSPILIAILIVVYTIGHNKGEAEKIEYYESLPAETIYVEVTRETESNEMTEVILDEEAVALAVLADTSAAGRSDNVKMILMWLAINRVEDHSNGYGGSLIEEINRPKQWQGYDPEGMYLQTTYDIAVEVLDTWRSNRPRPIYNDMLWSVYNSDGSITIRNKFKDDKGRSEQTFY